MLLNQIQLQVWSKGLGLDFVHLLSKEKEPKDTHENLRLVWKGEEKPEQWRKTVIVQLYKGKGDLDQFSNLRNIHTKQEISYKAYNGFLQRLPSVVFILFAGPLSDSFGRKPFLIIPLVGFFLLNLVFVINTIWFQELKVKWIVKHALELVFTTNDINLQQHLF